MPKFKLKAKAEKLDDIVELYRPAYVEKDGVFHLDPEKLEAIEFDDKAELAGVVKKERDARAKAEAEAKKFDKFKSLIEDEDEIEPFLEAWAKRHEQGNGDGKGKPDEKNALELKDKLHAKELKKVTDELSTLRAANEKAQTELKDFRLWTPLRDVAIKAGVIAEDWDLARLDLSNKGQFGFDEDGKVVVIEDGQPSSVGPEKFFKEVYPDIRPKFYKASGAAGSGAVGSNGTNGHSKTVTREEFDRMPQQQQSALVAEVSAGKAKITD